MRKFFALLLLASPAFCSCASAWDNGYKYCASFVVASGKITGTLTNWTGMIDLSLIPSVGDTLKTAANGGGVQNTGNTTCGGGATLAACPDDLIVTTDQNGGSLTSWEVEDYSPTAGTGHLWPKLGSAAVGTTLYLFWGQAAVTTFQGGTCGAAYHASYAGVFDLATTTGYNSVTCAAGTPTGPPATATGKVNGGVQFGGHTTDVILSDVNLGGLTAFTYTSWMYATGVGGSTAGRLISGGANIYTEMTGIELDRPFSTTQGSWQTGETYLNGWHFVAITYDGSSTANVPKMSWDGGTLTNMSQLAAPVGSVTTTAVNATIGNHTTLARGFVGILDESRVYNGILTQAWISADYANQSAPSTFWAMTAPVSYTPTNSGNFFLVLR